MAKRKSKPSKQSKQEREIERLQSVELDYLTIRTGLEILSEGVRSGDKEALDSLLDAYRDIAKAVKTIRASKA